MLNRKVLLVSSVLMGLLLANCTKPANKIVVLFQVYEGNFRITDSLTTKSDGITVTKIDFEEIEEGRFSDGVRFHQQVRYTIFHSNNKQDLDSTFNIYTSSPREICLQTEDYLILIEFGPDNSRHAISRTYELIREVFSETPGDKIYFHDQVL